jgi:signal transduction histidine kinase
MQVYLRRYGIQTWLILPLHIEERVVAFAELWENRQRREFGPEEISLCQGIGQQAAIAIQNARLYQRAQQEIAERKQAEAELQQYKAHLEEEVAARTQELTRINAELQAEIIEREQVEVALIQARDEALAANRLKTELLANVSHELRTPLSVIMGFVELLEMGSYGPVIATQAEVLAKILVQSQRQLGLINDLLDQARLEAGELNLNISHFGPSALLEDIRARMTELAQAKGLTLIVEVAATMPAVLSGDLARLQQVLTNLVDNAIKFTEQGQVEVRLYRLNDEQWVMEVADTGPGIPVEAQAHIFEPFGQRDSSVTRSHGGLGLGLSIARQLVTLMKGEFSLESQVGQGSVFRVTLPLSPSSESDD